MSVFRSCQMRYCPDPGAVSRLKMEGLFSYGEENDRGIKHKIMMLNLPYSDPASYKTIYHMLRIVLSEEEKTGSRASWIWDGNVHLPTLSPSVLLGDRANPIWHGWIKNGHCIGT